MGVSVRLWQPKTAEDRQIFSKFLSVPAAGEGWQLTWSFDLDELMKVDENSFYMIAETDGIPVGIIKGTLSRKRLYDDDPSSICGHIGALRIDRSYQRAGIGSALLRAAEIELARRNCQFVDAAILSNNAASLGLFINKFGYQSFIRFGMYWINAASIAQKPLNWPSTVKVIKHSGKKATQLIQKTFEKSFYFPERTTNASVYTAEDTSTEASVSVHVAELSAGISIVSMPWKLLLAYYLLMFLNWLMPSRFDAPCRLKKPYPFKSAYPIFVNEPKNRPLSSHDRHLLLRCAISSACLDAAAKNGVLMLPDSSLMTGIPDMATAIKSTQLTDLVSPLLRGNVGAVVVAKALSPENHDKILESAARRDFWFMLDL